MKKTSILFICHGNICRSPMAQSVFSHLLSQNRFTCFKVDSAAAHRDEIGSEPHYGTRKKLQEEGVPLIPHRARLLTAQDGDAYDFLIGMDDANVRDILRIVGEKNKNKVFRLLDFSSRPRPIADPWYTGNFDETYKDILEGSRCFLAHLKERGLIE